MLVLLSIPLLAFASSAVSEALPPQRLIYESPTGFFLENIAVRPCSKFLLTSVISPTLFTLDPTAAVPTLDPVFTFPNSTALTGIVEFRPEVYAVTASKLNASTARVDPGSVAIWSVDFSSSFAHPVVTKLASLPPLNDSGFNGLASIPGRPDVILAAESAAGSVWEINTHTGASRIAIQDESMTPGPIPGPLIIGINGIHVRDNTLYFTSSLRSIYSRVSLDVRGPHVMAAGAVQQLVHMEGIPDDFAIDTKGRAWVSIHPAGLSLLHPVRGAAEWVQTNVASDPNMYKDPTSVAFGRGDRVQQRTAYVVTAAGQIVAVDTEGV
ncbi:hypothetical protein C8J57DRAFT_752725 [Mycena rebaudengoi]|nr:hypothetical protein C8J57DRAFT_752725 [Mycena rebaudengoi]